MTELVEATAGTPGQFTAQGVTFHFGHRVLGDFAYDLASGLSHPVSAPVDVFVGAHVNLRPPETGRFRIGIQTEQMLDQNGKRMWAILRREDRLALVTGYDAVLDLSPDNRMAYRFLPADIRRKVRFGPHIFPDHDLTSAFVDAPPLFVGWMNDRRRAVIGRLRDHRPVETLSKKVFGAALAQKLAGQGSILNIHFRDGIYTEYPRFLKACLAGKPVISEPMSAPLIEGEHYLPLDEVATFETTERIFAALRVLAARYRFRAFLEGLFKGRATP